MILKFLIITALTYSAVAEVVTPTGVWREWSNCTDGQGVVVQCDGGTKFRSKYCPLPAHLIPILNMNEIKCQTSEVTCASMSCYDPFAGVEFSECSALCDGGNRSRTGVFENGTVITQTISCHNHKCQPENQICNGTDLVIMVDSSGSLGTLVWPVMKQFVIDLVHALEVDTSNNRVSLITYSTEVYNNFHLNNDHSLAEYVDLIWNVPYYGGSTATAEVLMELKTEMAEHAIGNHPHIGLLITDGSSNILSDMVEYMANAAKNDSIYIIGVGVGEYNREEMDLMVNSPSNFSLFSIDDMESLQSIVNIVSNKVCNASQLRPCAPCEYSDCNAPACGMLGQMTGTSHCYSIDPLTGNEHSHRVVSCPPRFCFISCTPPPVPSTTTEELVKTTTTENANPTTTTVPGQPDLTTPTSDHSEIVTTPATDDATTQTTPPGGDVTETPGTTPATTTTAPVDTPTTTESPNLEIPDCDRCDYTNGQVWRPDYLNCHEYYVCEFPVNNVYEFHHVTCGQLYWDQERLTCTEEPSGICVIDHVVIAPVVTAYDDTCRFSAVNGDDSEFWVEGDLSTVQKCPAGLFFNDTNGVCTCVRRQGVTIPTDGCEDDIIIDIPYETTYDDVSCHKAKAIQSGIGINIENDPIRGNVACFNGSGYFEIPFFRNWFSYNNVQEFTLSFSMLKSSSATATWSAINNQDCKANSTFEVSGVNQEVYGELKTDVDGSIRTHSYHVDNNKWYDVKILYDGVNFTFELDGLPVEVIPASGDMSNNPVSMVIGARCDSDYFSGCLDDIKLYDRIVLTP